MVADSLGAENEKAANSMRWAAFEKLERETRHALGA